MRTLQTGLRYSLFLWVALSSLRAAATRRPPQLWLYNIHTRQEVQLDPYAYNGVLDWNVWARLNGFFRSWRTHEAHPIAPRLLELLVKIQATYGGRRIELVSGFRSPGERDSLSQSNHFEGDAADIRIPGVANRELFELCRTLPGVGCGLYPNGSHVHVDVRPRSAIWVDLSGYGDGARYVAHPDDWLRRNPDAAGQMTTATAQSTRPARHHGRSSRRR